MKQASVTTHYMRSHKSAAFCGSSGSGLYKVWWQTYGQIRKWFLSQKPLSLYGWHEAVSIPEALRWRALTYLSATRERCQERTAALSVLMQDGGTAHIALRCWNLKAPLQTHSWLHTLPKNLHVDHANKHPACVLKPELRWVPKPHQSLTTEQWCPADLALHTFASLLS